MTDKELKHLGRAELIEIVYEQQKRLEQAEAKVAELQESLDKRDLNLSSAGSIADAALKVNHVFEAAQAAADQYLGSIKAATDGVKERMEAAEAKRQAVLDEAERKSAEMLQTAEFKAAALVKEAEQKAAETTQAAELKAAETTREAETRAKVVVGAAEMQASEKWAEFERRAKELIAANEELRAILGMAGKSGGTSGLDR